MNRISFFMIIIGIILIVTGLSLIAIKSQVKLIGERIVDNATIKFDNEDIRILSFNASRDGNYKLKIEIVPVETSYGGIAIKPLVYAVLVDDEGLKGVLSNTTAYIYLKVSGLEESKEFTIDNLSGSKRYHIIFSTPLPEQIARVSVNIIYASKPEEISLIDISMLVVGITIIIGSMIIFRSFR